MNIRAFFKATNRKTLEISEHGVGNFTSQKEAVDFFKLMIKALNENPELVIEFKIKNLNYLQGEKA